MASPERLGEIIKGNRDGFIALLVFALLCIITGISIMIRTHAVGGISSLVIGVALGIGSAVCFMKMKKAEKDLKNLTD